MHGVKTAVLCPFLLNLGWRGRALGRVSRVRGGGSGPMHGHGGRGRWDCPFWLNRGGPKVGSCCGRGGVKVGRRGVTQPQVVVIGRGDGGAGVALMGWVSGPSRVIGPTFHFGILKVTGPAQSVGASLWGQSSSLMTQPSVKGGGGVKGSSSAKQRG